MPIILDFSGIKKLSPPVVKISISDLKGRVKNIDGNLKIHPDTFESSIIFNDLQSKAQIWGVAYSRSYSSTMECKVKRMKLSIVLLYLFADVVSKKGGFKSIY